MRKVYEGSTAKERRRLAQKIADDRDTNWSPVDSPIERYRRG